MIGAALEQVTEVKRCIISSSEFDRQWVEIGLGEDDRLQLDYYLANNPTAGDIIPQTKGFRKLRYVLKRGKSGGARIIYIDYCYHEKLYLALVYDKTKKLNLTQTEIHKLNVLADELKKLL